MLYVKDPTATGKSCHGEKHLRRNSTTSVVVVVHGGGSGAFVCKVVSDFSNFTLDETRACACVCVCVVCDDGLQIVKVSQTITFSFCQVQ